MEIPILPKVIFTEANSDLMDPDILKKVQAAGVVLYRETAHGCWMVVSHKPDGGGHAKIQRQGKYYPLHRIMWVQLHGPIPDGHGVYQRCQNRCCVHPAHLMMGTPAEIRQEAHKGRMPDDTTLTTTPLTARDKELINRLAHFGASRRTITLAFGISRMVFDWLRQEDLGLTSEW